MKHNNLWPFSVSRLYCFKYIAWPITKYWPFKCICKISFSPNLIWYLFYSLSWYEVAETSPALTPLPLLHHPMSKVCKLHKSLQNYHRFCFKSRRDPFFVFLHYWTRHHVVSSSVEHGIILSHELMSSSTWALLFQSCAVDTHSGLFFFGEKKSIRRV